MKAASNKSPASIDAYWRATNHVSVGLLYLLDYPLLKERLEQRHLKPAVLGHWGRVPGQDFIYIHLNLVIGKYDLDMICISDPGHGGPALAADTYLEDAYSGVHPDITRDEAHPEYPAQLERWTRSCRPEEPFDADGRRAAHGLESARRRQTSPRNIGHESRGAGPPPLRARRDLVEPAGQGVRGGEPQEDRADRAEPDVVKTAYGDVPTPETPAAVSIIANGRDIPEILEWK